MAHFAVASLLEFFGKNVSEEKLKVLMFGWEFPPHNSGGLGTACFGLTKALSQNGTEITFVLPKQIDVSAHRQVRASGPTNGHGAGRLDAGVAAGKAGLANRGFLRRDVHNHRLRIAQDHILRLHA